MQKPLIKSRMIFMRCKTFFHVNDTLKTVLILSLIIHSLPFLLYAPPALSEPKKIILSGDHAFPPGTFMKHEQPNGYIIDVSRAVARSVDLELEIQLMPWKTALEKLKSGDVDVIAMSYSDTRGKSYEFSAQFALNAFGLMVKTNSNITDIKDIQGLNILVQQGGVMQDYIKSEKIDANFTYLEDVRSILIKLESDGYDGALLSKKTGYYLKKQMGLSGLIFTKENINPRKTAFAVTKGNYELIHYLNEGLSIINTNGELQTINEKWFGVKEEKPIDLEFIKTLGLM